MTAFDEVDRRSGNNQCRCECGCGLPRDDASNPLCEPCQHGDHLDPESDALPARDR